MTDPFRTAGARQHGDEGTAANRRWWDDNSAGYLAEHGDFLGDARFLWGPEGLDEAQARLLGEVAGRRVLEVGCGAAQCARWLRRRGADVVALDLSAGMLAEACAIDRRTGVRLALVQGDATALPFADGTFDLACSAYGGVPFVADSAAVMSEVARVLRPGGRWAFSVSHPIRWAFPDDPGPAGLTATLSYFDRRPYVESDQDGTVTYAEHHRTLGDRVAEIVAAGLSLRALVEPEWPERSNRIWGGWSPLRGQRIPGTAIFVADKPE
ncbi:MAG: class I SAM-dependent methyltransferase [Actinomycetota bacterium]|nr:class I SAM-dependent methyltransferase [Actinomycetota bacterium]